MAEGGRTGSGERLLILAAVAVLIGGTAYDFHAFSAEPATITEIPATSSSASNSSSTEYVTGTIVTETDTFFTASCPPSTGGGAFEFRIVSDSNGQPVSGETVNEVNSGSCSNQTFSETQVVYVRTFVVGPGGWLSNNDYPGGIFTVVYDGRTYTFSGAAPPIGTNCLTLRVPSGNVTSAVPMNGYC